ncbi:unannotated protein [freshwater metagenome]|uniref:Unannotated protein n=1 Tax=freshwater metagenome TaxID=449393 RepID=A0A6J7XRJ3_9ZZZZ|nr:prolipoprotein diacylglyceryl transferase [Actinomycetota bacterium]
MLRSIPTPTISVVEIGPLTVHFYALCIITGIAIAIWMGEVRFRKNGENLQGVVSDIAMWSVPAGIIGGRIYHVLTSPDQYFGSGGHPLDAIKIWEGGLGIWGAISLGSVTAFFAYKNLAKSKELPKFAFFLDALAPGVLIAQGIGRFGNWFNGELFGRPLNAPFALEIPANLRPVGFEKFETFHPTFAYEALWCFLIAGILIWLTPRLKAGMTFTLYVFLYCVGRFFIEALRIDSAHTIMGLRLNVWVSVVVGLISLGVFARISRQSGRL